MNPVRTIAMLLTPPCSECAHSVFVGIGGYMLCRSPKAIDRYERLACCQKSTFECADVRCTPSCRFERRK